MPPPPFFVPPSTGIIPLVSYFDAHSAADDVRRRALRASASPVSFVVFLRTTFPHTRTVAWDLDGTLGALPGWGGTGLLSSYIRGHAWLRDVLGRLHDHGVRNILVSRNGSFCGHHLAAARRKFLALGFDAVANCYRHREGSKVTGLGVSPDRVLLIDDQQGECNAAVRDGGAALHVMSPLPAVFAKGDFTVMRRLRPGPLPAAKPGAPVRRRRGSAIRHRRQS